MLTFKAARLQIHSYLYENLEEVLKSLSFVQNFKPILPQTLVIIVKYTKLHVLKVVRHILHVAKIQIVNI
jgi:hypothetical protein